MRAQMVRTVMPLAMICAGAVVHAESRTIAAPAPGQRLTVSVGDPLYKTERYDTETLPGKVVEPGNEVTVKSDIVVVPGSLRQEALIEERITIFDNEDHTKPLRNLTKAVNGDTRRGGHYQNEFAFTPPEGLPQGVYPVKTELILNGVIADTSDNDIQLVLQVDHLGAMQLLALAD